MAKEIKIPEISEGVETATVGEILVSEGDSIEEGQEVLSVETDKATAEVPSSSGGTIKEIKVSQGDEVNVGDVVILLEESDEGEGENEDEVEDENEGDSKEKDKSDDEDEADAEEKEAKKESDSEEDDDDKNDESKDKAEAEDDKGGDKSSKKEKEDSSKEDDKNTSSKNGSKIHASPGTRRIAREMGVDLSAIEGSGDGGRITADDVKNHSKGGGSSQKTGTSGLSKLPDFSKWGATETKKLNNIRKKTAENMSASWQNIPHVFQFEEADISAIEEYIEDHREKVKKAGGKLTITAVLTKVVAMALHRFPKFNASLDLENEQMILKKYVNISVAVATEKGLLVPVLKNADQKSITAIAVEIGELAQQARDGKLSQDDMKGGNFSISNLGGVGGTNFTPIVYHPQAAILGVSRAQTKPLWNEELSDFEPRSILPISLSYDHRLIDGAEGAEFAHWIARALEDPFSALME
jgi:pyruvate dehydrogenase E2 component (dihydrolipoamide acetyltransferase)